jgi:hypothetical protein
LSAWETATVTVFKRTEPMRDAAKW